MPSPLNYSEKDFEIIKGKETGDKRIAYIFKSKDGKIEANFFWQPDDVLVKGLIYNGDEITHNFGVAYPFVNRHGDGVLPEPEKILKNIILHLSRGEYKPF